MNTFKLLKPSYSGQLTNLLYQLKFSTFIRRSPRQVIWDNSGENVSSNEDTRAEQRRERKPTSALKYAIGRGEVDYTNRRKKTQSQVPIITVPKKMTVVRNQALSKSTAKTKILASDFNEAVVELEYLEQIKSLYKPRNRRESGEVVVEGRRLIQDALEAGCTIATIFYSKQSEMEQIDVDDSKKIRVTEKFWRRASKLTTPPGVMAIVKMPKNEVIVSNSENALPLILILDQLREPGNLGSVLRSIAAVHCTKVLMASRCCDPWDWKVLRGSMGANFRVPLTCNIPVHSIRSHLPTKFNLFVAWHSPYGTASAGAGTNEAIPVVNLFDINVDFNTPSVLVVGGETLGLSEEMHQFVEDHNATGIHIDMANGVESLNIAAAVSIITYEFRRQFTRFQASS